MQDQVAAAKWNWWYEATESGQQLLYVSKMLERAQYKAQDICRTWCRQVAGVLGPLSMWGRHGQAGEPCWGCPARVVDAGVHYFWWCPQTRGSLEQYKAQVRRVLLRGWRVNPAVLDKAWEGLRLWGVEQHTEYVTLPVEAAAHFRSQLTVLNNTEVKPFVVVPLEDLQAWAGMGGDKTG